MVYVYVHVTCYMYMYMYVYMYYPDVSLSYNLLTPRSSQENCERTPPGVAARKPLFGRKPTGFTGSNNHSNNLHDLHLIISLETNT